jgi:hypothetical protein
MESGATDNHFITAPRLDDRDLKIAYVLVDAEHSSRQHLLARGIEVDESMNPNRVSHPRLPYLHYGTALVIPKPAIIISIILSSASS